MAKVKIVTDSTADLPSALAKELGIVVIPHRLRIGKETYLDGVTITADEFIARMGKGPLDIEIIPPSIEDFRQAYAKLSQVTDAIISIHLSAKLSDAYKNAIEAKDLLHERSRIVVIDTQQASLGVGFIAETAARAANAGASLEEVARLVRGMLSQTHILFFVENTEYLQKRGYLPKTQATSPYLANVKPLLRLESGEIFSLERVRTRAKALERLYEFVADFPKIERMAILYSTTQNEAENLARRIDPVFPKDKIIIAKYGPVWSAHFGLAAMAVVVYEGEE